ncbi:MAG: transposase [Spirochaetales bacterium]|nr:transposase [Spirochaetales bacterium]
MSEKKTKSYTAEFKESAVKLAVESDQPVTVTARELGVNVNTLHTWIGKLHRPKVQQTPGRQEHNDEHVYDELKRLRKEVAKLKEERAILKKAAAFFAKECH